jgi:phosphoserine aminotransferase
MHRAINFSAGPAALPLTVLEQARSELLDFRGTGMGVMEMSHRGEVFMAVAAEAEADFRELLAIPENYRVLFLQGGGIGEFAAVPLNLLRGADKADYINTGTWSTKGIEEARKYCNVQIAASAEDRHFSYVPAPADWQVRHDAAYLHLCTNETIHGVEMPFCASPPEFGVPLVADMSSHILSRVIDVSRYGCIYAGAQKNIGPSGLVLVVVRDDLLGKPHPHCPSFIDYTLQARNGWMFNTPNTWGVYLAGLVFKWLKAQGGVAAIEQRNIAKARLLYNAIDDSGGFYRCPVAVADRSRMNVPFRLGGDALEAAFLRGAEEIGLTQLKGHRAVGGLRASIYNAMPLAGVVALVDYMQSFQQCNG